MLTNKKEILRKALTRIFDGIAQLNKAFPGKAFTIDGRLVGDIGEIIATLEYDIELYTTQRACYDGEAAGGRKVQVKATFQDSLTFRTIPDYYLGFKLFKDGSHEEIFNGPGRIIYNRYKHRKGIGKTLLRFPISELRKLSNKVSNDERIQKRI